MVEQDIQSLREDRITRRIRLREAAEALGIDSSLLSHIEAGRRRPKVGLLSRYADFLAGVEARGDQAPVRDPIVSRVLRSIQEFEPLTLDSLRRQSVPLRLRSNEKELSSYLDEVLQKGFDQSGVLTFVWNSRIEYDESIIYAAARASILQSRRFQFYFAPSALQDERILEIIWLLESKLRYTYYRSRIDFDSVRDLNFGLFPIDFFVLHGSLADLRFSSRRFKIKEGMVVRSNIEALTSYMEKVATYRDNRVTLFRGAADLMKWLDAYKDTENASGPRLLAQSLLGSHTRPPEHYNPEGSWWRRYEHFKREFDTEFTLERLAAQRIEAHSRLRVRILNFPVRQICSRAAIERWALEGERADIEQYGIVESPDDRIERVDYVLHLLENYRQFEIAILDQQEDNELGWFSASQKRGVSWLIQGRDKFMFETNIDNDIESTNSDDGEEVVHNQRRLGMGLTTLDLHGLVNSERICAAFTAYFNNSWLKLKPDNREKGRVISYLRELSRRMSQNLSSH
jgi:transcriptional regulator with XRE-family HTH domain